MNKKFKKVVAVGIAALMALTTFPVTALASATNAGELRPEVYATYYTHDDDEEYTVSTALGDGLGTKAAVEAMGPYNGLMCGPARDISAIKALSAGEIFSTALWLKADGVDTMESITLTLTYDDTQIQPLYIETKKTGTTTRSFQASLCGRDQAKADLEAGTVASIKDVSQSSCNEYRGYTLWGDGFDDTMGAGCDLYTEDGFPASNVYYACGTGSVKNLQELTGGGTDVYDYNAEMNNIDSTHYDDYILVTLAFITVADNPTSVLTPKVDYIGGTAKGYPATCYESYLEQGLYTCDASYDKGTMYECPCNGYMTVLGVGYNAAQPSTDNTVTYVDADGQTISTETVAAGGSPADVPDLPATTKDATNHTTYAWDTDPTTATIDADTTFTQVATVTAHTWDAGTVTTEPTHTAAGVKTFTCDVCGQTKTEAVAATGHTPAATPTSNNNGTHSYLCTEDNAVCSTESCTYNSVVTPATCTEDGYTTYTCTKCGYEYEGDVTTKTGHTYGAWAHDAATTGASATHSRACTAGDDTQTAACTFTSEVTQQASATKPEITTYTCSVCGYEYTAETASPLGHTHNYGTPVADYTSGQAKTDAAYTHSQTCTTDDGSTCSAPTKTTACTFDSGVVTTPATCGAAGVKTFTCSECGGTYTVAIPATGEHNYSAWTHDAATTGAAATHSKTCSVCGDTQTAACTFTSAVTQQATYTKPEMTTYTCSDCGYQYTAQTGPTLVDNRVSITVEGTSDGTTAIGETPSTDGKTVKYNVGDKVTLTATPNENYEFVGWQQNKTIVSTSATYTTTAFTDITYTPLFMNKATELQVVFLDKFGNVVEVKSAASAADIKAPTAPSIVGYTFTGWDKDYSTTTESMTVNALYEKNADLFTVTATGCDLTDGTTTSTDSIQAPFDKKVTLTKSDATAWQINGVTVAYGDTYSFFVTGDVTVTPITTAVTAVPTVLIKSAKLMDGSDYKVSFDSTYSVPAGYTFIQTGFVYGKSLAEADLTLDKVGQTGTGSGDSGKIKAIYSGSTLSEGQTILNYGVSTKTGTASAKAFIVVKDSAGTVSTIYTPTSVYTY